jgi:hypothetical protein
VRESIRQATEKDLNQVRNFIDKHWASKHILSTSKELFDFQYHDKYRKKYNFYLAEVGSEITGIIGFTNNSQYSTEVSNTVNWLSMWKISPRALPGQGLRLIKKIEIENAMEPIGTIGCNLYSKNLYSKLGYKTGQLRHLFAYSSQVPINQKSLIDDVINIPHRKYNLSELSLKPLLTTVEINNTIARNCAYLSQDKDQTFYLNRYHKNPFYDYLFLSLEDPNKQSVGFVISRIVQGDKFKVLRILEIITSPETCSIYIPLRKFLENHEIQFADYYHFEISEIQRKYDLIELPADLNLPNLYEPFEPQKKVYHFAIKNYKNNSLRLTRGDCDQDRPNKI